MGMAYGESQYGERHSLNLIIFTFIEARGINVKGARIVKRRAASRIIHMVLTCTQRYLCKCMHMYSRI